MRLWQLVLFSVVHAYPQGIYLDGIYGGSTYYDPSSVPHTSDALNMRLTHMYRQAATLMQSKLRRSLLRL